MPSFHILFFPPGSFLTRHPDAVIYLDEIEKAIPSAGDLLLAMLDQKGSLQVSKTGQHISTVKATWILSSNLATNLSRDAVKPRTS